MLGTRSNPNEVIGVKRLADYLKRKLELDPNLKGLAVRGEVSNYNVSARGHLNFDLKEEDAVLKCFAWSDDFLRFPSFKNGNAIVAVGTVSTYQSRSLYQLVVRQVELLGIGDVHALFEERKRKLAAEGMFDPRRKRSIPSFPFRVALVSSKRAEGATDFVTRLRDRRPHVRVTWCETSVQGPSAPAEIIGALGRASRLDVDVIVVTRGGGSFEDLFAFSDEQVVRAVAHAQHPVISAVGHTVDQQLCDFVADLHAETPSAAAERIGPETRELRERLENRLQRAQAAAWRSAERLRVELTRALTRSKLSEPKLFFTPLVQRLDDRDRELAAALSGPLRARESALRELGSRLAKRDPSRQLAERGQRLTQVSFRLDAAVKLRFAASERQAASVVGRLAPAARGPGMARGRRLQLAATRLDGNNPEAILQRGYAIVSYRDAIVRDPRDVPIGERIAARVARGTLSARVEASESDGNQRIG